MKTIFHFLKPYKIHIIIAYTLTFIELIADLIFPLILAWMINDGVMTKDINIVKKWGIVMFIIAAITFLSGIINSFFASHISVQFAYRIRKKLFAHIQAFTFEQLGKFPSSVLVTRFTNDVRQIQNTIFMGLRIMARAPFLIIGSVLMALYVNFKISFIFVFTIPLLLIFLYWVLIKGSNMFKMVQKYVDRVNQSIQENIAGMRTIRSFVQSKFENNRFTKANTDLANQTRTAFRFLESSMPVLLFGMNIGLLFILWFGHQQVLFNQANVGEVVAIINYALRIVMAISLLTFITLAFSRAKASVERVNQIFDEKPNEISQLEGRLFTGTEQGNKTELESGKKAEKPFSIEGKICFERVSFTYPNTTREILQNINLTIQKGEKLAVIGATGSGKTTLFQLIPRLYEPTKGNILIDDRPITQVSIKELRDQIGYVPQSPLLFSGTIRDNITFGKQEATDEDVVQAAKDAQIHDTILQFNDGYNTIVGQRGINLSGGQKQRISIARALIRKPKILLFDDSTSALDLTTEAKLLVALAHYDATMLFITQKISTAQRADKIMLLHEGKIIAHGIHAELLESSPLYVEIVTSQSEEVSHAL